MEVFENGKNKTCDIRLIDFPFICRICLRRGDLRLFKQEVYLLDLFVAITNIDVRSTVNFPSNVCNECINELGDISLFIDISKYNDSRPGKNVILKKEIEFVAIVDFGMFREPVIKTEKTTGEYNEEDICTEKSEICRICLVSSCLIPFEEKAHLMQLFQNITNIDLGAASNFSTRNKICNKCINKLESISSFISLSLSNNMKIESILGRNGSLKTENCLEGNEIGFCTSKGNDMIFDNIADRKEVKAGNYFDESVCSYESKDTHTFVDIKKEILHCPEALIRENDWEGLEFCSETKSVEKQECDSCKIEFSSENHRKMISKGLRVSLEAHLEMKRFKCDFCEKSFSRKYSVQKHMLIHPEHKSFKCDHCEKKFISKDKLKYHSFTHSGEKPFKCDGCEKRFIIKQNLKRHMLTHTGEKPFKCGSCEKSFNQNRDLKIHILSHAGEKPFKCESCEKRFNLKQSLEMHMLIHTGKKPFKCESCEKSYILKPSLKQHMLVHTGEKPFKCDFCEKSFAQKGHMRVHLITHTGETPFKCDSCEKSFNRKESLKRHMRTHTGEKPFKCDICQKGFSRKEDSMKHVRTHT